MKFAIVFTISIFVSVIATATPMVRVIRIDDVRTIVVDRNGVAAQVRLADITINPEDEAAALAYLQHTLIGSWVLVEGSGLAGSYVYRSPDGLFVNGALTSRAYFERGPKMIYLGEAQPGPQRQVSRSQPAKETVAIVPPAKPRRARTTPKGAHRIPRLP